MKKYADVCRIFILAYLLITFIVWDFNPGNWHLIFRIVFVLIFAIPAGINEYYKPKKDV